MIIFLCEHVCGWCYQEDLHSMGLANVVMGGGAAKDVHIFRLRRAREGGTRTLVAAAFSDASVEEWRLLDE
jgi:hypothetical protein